MPKGIYPRTEEHKKKIGESRRRFYDEHGRVVNINQKESTEAYRSYQREYQKIWRKRHPHYYRDLKRDMKTQESDNMKKTMKQEVEELKNEITRLQNVIADLELKLQISSQNDTQKEYITSVSSVPSTQACSEEELLNDMMKFTEHK